MWIEAQRTSQDHKTAVNTDSIAILGVERNRATKKWAVVATLVIDDPDESYILGDYGTEIEANAAYEEVLSALDFDCDVFRMPDQIMIEG